MVKKERPELFRKKADTSKDRGLKKLSEKEIQKQLYGNYLDKEDSRVEVMDSSAIAKEFDKATIKEEIDGETKKEIENGLKDIQSEFKRLSIEVKRLRKEKEVLEHSVSWFKLPFLKTKYLVIIGSLVILSAVIIVSFLAIRFIVKEVGAKALVPEVKKTDTAVKIYTIQVSTSFKRDDAERVIRNLSSKKISYVLDENKTDSGKIKYVIYAGSYEDRQEAEKAAKRLKNERLFRDCFVLSKHQ